MLFGSTSFGLTMIALTRLVSPNHRLLGSLYLAGTFFLICSDWIGANNPSFAALLMRAESTSKMTSAFELFPSRFNLSISVMPVASIKRTLMPVFSLNVLKTWRSVL